jgi:hypothetical protein
MPGEGTDGGALHRSGGLDCGIKVLEHIGQIFSHRVGGVGVGNLVEVIAGMIQVGAPGGEFVDFGGLRRHGCGKRSEIDSLGELTRGPNGICRFPDWDTYLRICHHRWRKTGL